MRKALLPVLCVTGTALALPIAAVAVDVAAKSKFSNSAEGWGLAGVTATPSPVYRSSGGNPGGYIQVEDGNADELPGQTDMYFVAPAKFLGDRRSSYGTHLSFDLRQSDAGPIQCGDDADVTLSGAGLTLERNIKKPSEAPSWRHYDVLLRASLWDMEGGGEPSRGQMRDVLGSLEAMQVKAEYRCGSEVTGLDSVVLRSR